MLGHLPALSQVSEPLSTAGSRVDQRAAGQPLSGSDGTQSRPRMACGGSDALALAGAAGATLSDVYAFATGDRAG